MNQHFRTAVMAIVLAGGTLSAYVAAYAMMDTPAVNEQTAVNPTRDNCSGPDVSSRGHCTSTAGVVPMRPVRIVGATAGVMRAETETVIVPVRPVRQAWLSARGFRRERS